MEAKILTKAEMKKALEDANCPPDLIDKIGQDLSLWWKAGWIQEILLAQKKAGEQTQRDRQSTVEAEAYFRGRNDGLTILEANVEEARLNGIREVVEWIESVPPREIDGADQYTVTLEQWQAKLKDWLKDNPELLKEWGIENKIKED